MRWKVVRPIRSVAILIVVLAGVAACGSGSRSGHASASRSSAGAPAAVTRDLAYVTASATSAVAPSAVPSPASHASRLVAHDPALSPSPAPPIGRLYLVMMRGWGSAAGRAHQAFAQVYVGLSGVCWNFSSLRGFRHPDGARIHLGARGRAVLTLSSARRFRLVGCVWAPHALIVALKHHPRRYYVAMRTPRYPSGVVRAQLRGS